MHRSAPALLLTAVVGFVGAASAHAQSECPALLHAPSAGVRWCDLATPPRLAPDAQLPAYPVMLRSARYSGEVDLTADVDDSGRVVPASVHVLFSTHDLFLVSARAAVRRWRFEDPGGADRPFTLLVRTIFEIPPEQVPTTPVADVTPTPAGLDLRLGRSAIPFAPPAHVDRGDVDAAMAAAIDAVVALQPRDSLRAVCITHAHGALSARAMAMLHTPGRLTFGPERCPRASESMVRIVDSLGRPPGDADGRPDPLSIDVVDVEAWTPDLLRVRVSAMLGDGGTGYLCDASRQTAGRPWIAECDGRRLLLDHAVY